MDALEKFLSGSQAVAEPPKKQASESTRIPADVQAQRDKDALAIHEAELKQAKD